MAQNLPIATDDLASMFGPYSAMPTVFGMQKFNDSRDNNTINQAAALQDLYQNEQTNPLEIQAKQLANQEAQARLPGVIADNTIKQNKAKLSSATLDSDTATQLSENDVKQLDNYAQKLLYSSNPQEQELGKHLAQMHRDVVKEREKQKYIADRQSQLEGQRGKNQKDLLQMQIDAGRFKKGGAGSKAVEDLLLQAKTWQQKANILEQAYNQARIEGADQAVIDDYYNRLQAAIQQDISRLPDPTRNKIDMPGATNMPAAPTRQATPYPAAAPKAPASAQKTIVRTGTHNGRKVVQFSDGSIEYAD